MAWLLLQAGDILLGNFGAPQWVFRSFAVLLLLGFPLALFLSWAYELTPEGVRRSADLQPTDLEQTRKGRSLDGLILAGALAVIAVMVVERAWFASREDAVVPAGQPQIAAGEVRAPARSIAVLAFDDLSPEGDQAYFAEGISEELLNLLARIEDLKVAARTSSFKFKGSRTDIGEIGRALNVETVLEGSVRKAGNQVRVTAQLINTVDGFHVWSESYDRRLENIFAVQDEIAGAIVEALSLKFDIATATAARTENTQAYDHYLRGRERAREPTRAGLLRGIEHYERAIAIDPGFAAAYAGIADAWVWLEDYGGFRSVEAFPRAEQAARRALELDPGSAEAHAAMAFVLDRYHEDKEAAREYFERTLELNPNYVNAWNLFGDTLGDLGERERAIEVHRKAVELDPLSVFMRTRLASKLTAQGQAGEARQIIEAVFAEFPGNDFAHEEMGNLERAKGRWAESMRHYRIVHFDRPGDPYAAAQIAMIAAGLEDPALADAWIDAARASGDDNRWELLARALVADWQGDWGELDRVGNVRGGDRGAVLRGIAASRQGHWPEARRYLLEALRMRRYQGEGHFRLIHAEPLIELAWVERQMGMPHWRQHLEVTRPLLARLVADGVTTLYGDDPVALHLARLLAMEGRREDSLAALRTAFETGAYHHWFLERDPAFAAWRDDPDFLAHVARVRAHGAAERAKLAGVEMLP